MEIIGKTNNGYMIDITEQELSNLVGHASFYYVKKNSKTFDGREFRLGAKIEISKMYEKIHNMNRDIISIDITRSKLEEIIKNLEPIRDTIKLYKEENDEQS